MARANGKEGIQFGPPQRGKEASSRPLPGRLCAQEGCATILSTYNASPTCWLHTGPAYRHPLYNA